MQPGKKEKISRSKIPTNPLAFSFTLSQNQKKMKMKIQMKMSQNQKENPMRNQ